MSGQQIGTAVGFVAGFFLPGGPQVWAAIGGFIGGVIDPTEIKGPHIGDGPQQSSNEGNSLAWVMGTAGWLQGNIVQISARREVKKEDDGKGGPVTVTYEAHQDYAIVGAESCELRDSSIVGVLMVRLNGKIVYDMRPSSNMGASNAKFLANHKFYYGAEDQMPDPTLEAITGVGNTPAYRGVFMMVARDINLSQYGDAIPTYEFVLVGAGETQTVTTESFVPYVYPGFVDSAFPLSNPEADYSITHSQRQTTGSGFTVFDGPFDSLEDAVQEFEGTQYLGGGFQYIGYKPVATDGTALSLAVTPPSIVDAVKIRLTYNETTAEVWMDGLWTQVSDVGPFFDAYPLGTKFGDKNGYVFTVSMGETIPAPPGVVSFYFHNGNLLYAYGIPPIDVDVERVPISPDIPMGDPCMLGVPVQLPDSPGYVIDCDGTVSKSSTYEDAPLGTYVMLQQEERDDVIGDGLSDKFIKYPLGPVLETTDPDNNETFWTEAAALAGVTGTYGVDYPVEVSDGVFVATQVTESLTSDPLSVATAIERICARGGLEPTDIDTEDIDATLLGYPIQSDYNGADCIKPLLAYCSSYASEYDAQIHFHPYGEAIEIVIGPDDFIEGSDETDDGAREQAKEYPRKVAVSYVDVDQNYTVRPQYAYRTTPDVRAIGEETIQIPLCDTADHASQIAEIAIKVAYSRLQGTRKFSVPYVGADTYLQLVSGMPFALEGKRWVANRVTLEDGLIAIEAAYDRQSAYTSNATGVPAQPPTPPESNIGGITLFAAMNLPALRDQDDKIGIYIAAAGLLGSWPGCLVQMSVDGMATWQTAIATITEPSTMGYLTAPLPSASPYGDDVTNTLSVAIHGGQLNSITYEQYLNEQNPFAIVKPDGTGELGQWVDADEITTDRYDMTTLGRGRLGSTPITHFAGARFVALDAVYFLELPSSYIGQIIWLRPVTFNTTPESNPVYSLVFSPAVSQTELAPAFLISSLVSDTLSLAVLPRHRFGTDLNPIASINFTGFRWRITDGTNVSTQDSAPNDPTTSFDVTGWASPINVQVSQLNRITGAGPALEEIL